MTKPTFLDYITLRKMPASTTLSMRIGAVWGCLFTSLLVGPISLYATLAGLCVTVIQLLGAWREYRRLTAQAILVAIAFAVGGCTLPTEVVNYRTYTDPSKGIYMIYDGVMDKGVLISDVGGSQTRVYITRQTQ